MPKITKVDAARRRSYISLTFMQTYYAEIKVEKAGQLTLKGLPFDKGEAVQVFIAAPEHLAPGYFLRGKPLQYQQPTEPVAQEDWESVQ